VGVKERSKGDLRFKGPRSSINLPIFIEKRKEALSSEVIGRKTGIVLQVAR